MDQVTVQSPNPDTNTTNIPEENVSTAPETAPEPAATSNEDSKAFDVKDLGNMDNPDDQLEALKAAGFLKDAPEDTKPEPETKPEEAKPEEQPQTHKLKINGQEKEVSYDELIKLAQMGGDYTRKTQELAAERKRYDELLSKVAGQKAEQPTPEEANKNKQSSIESQYNAAVAEAEKMLGIEPGDFNQFDSTHAFALQQVMMNHNTEKLAEDQLRTEIAQWSEAQAKDPMAQEIDSNFDHFIYQLGAQSADGQQKALTILAAKARFMAGQPTRSDCELLQAHWEYVRSALTAKKATANTTAPEIKKPEPPATEAPGAGNTAKSQQRFNKQKFRSLSDSPDDQLAMLKSLHYI